MLDIIQGLLGHLAQSPNGFSRFTKKNIPTEFRVWFSLVVKYTLHRGPQRTFPSLQMFCGEQGTLRKKGNNI